MVTPRRSASIESKKGSNATTCMPKPWRQIWAMVRPMNPKPMMVSVFPPSSESRGGVCITRMASTFFVCVGQAVGVGDPPAQRQHQSHGVFGHRGRVGPHRVDHQNPELGGGCHVDLVGAGGADEDHLEQGRPLAASPPSPGGAHPGPMACSAWTSPRYSSNAAFTACVPLYETIGAAQPDGTLGLVEAVDHFDVVGVLQQRVRVGVEQKGGNQNLLAHGHLRLPLVVDMRS